MVLLKTSAISWSPAGDVTSGIFFLSKILMVLLKTSVKSWSPAGDATSGTEEGVCRCSTGGRVGPSSLQGGSEGG